MKTYYNLGEICSCAVQNKFEIYIFKVLIIKKNEIFEPFVYESRLKWDNLLLVAF